MSGLFKENFSTESLAVPPKLLEKRVPRKPVGSGNSPTDTSKTPVANRLPRPPTRRKPVGDMTVSDAYDGPLGYETALKSSAADTGGSFLRPRDDLSHSNLGATIQDDYNETHMDLLVARGRHSLPEIGRKTLAGLKKGLRATSPRKSFVRLSDAAQNTAPDAISVMRQQADESRHNIIGPRPMPSRATNAADEFGSVSSATSAGTHPGQSSMLPPLPSIDVTIGSLGPNFSESAGSMIPAVPAGDNGEDGQAVDRDESTSTGSTTPRTESVVNRNRSASLGDEHVNATFRRLELEPTAVSPRSIVSHAVSSSRDSSEDDYPRVTGDNWKYHILKFARDMYMTTNPDKRHLTNRPGPSYYIEAQVHDVGNYILTFIEDGKTAMVVERRDTTIRVSSEEFGIRVEATENITHIPSVEQFTTKVGSDVWVIGNSISGSDKRVSTREVVFCNLDDDTDVLAVMRRRVPLKSKILRLGRDSSCIEEQSDDNADVEKVGWLHVSDSLKTREPWMWHVVIGLTFMVSYGQRLASKGQKLINLRPKNTAAQRQVLDS